MRARVYADGVNVFNKPANGVIIVAVRYVLLAGCFEGNCAFSLFMAAIFQSAFSVGKQACSTRGMSGIR